MGEEGDLTCSDCGAGLGGTPVTSARDLVGGLCGSALSLLQYPGAKYGRTNYLRLSKTGLAHLLYSPGDTGQGFLPAFSGLLATGIALSPAFVCAVDGACKFPLSSELEVSAGASSRIVPAKAHTGPSLKSLINFQGPDGQVTSRPSRQVLVHAPRSSLNSKATVVRVRSLTCQFKWHQSLMHGACVRCDVHAIAAAAMAASALAASWKLRCRTLGSSLFAA